ncbi:hypothetical protein QYS36_19180 [Pseudomonas sp. G34]|uniref:hypothetical protein n=1 Tax=Pseudomonas sp. G34 TaxID=3059083 RepID=UPI002806C4FE|nr:hypothetical protein [Pseudomonas sp. G34]MDQ7987068.1 hypothetical protein [Pseudomonas sp. G34]
MTNCTREQVIDLLKEADQTDNPYQRSLNKLTARICIKKFLNDAVPGREGPHLAVAEAMTPLNCPSLVEEVEDLFQAMNESRLDSHQPYASCLSTGLLIDLGI